MVVRQRIERKSKYDKSIKETVDCFYVVYILSTGLIDDLQTTLKFITDNIWANLPIQLHLINMSPKNIEDADLDSISFKTEADLLN